MKEITLKLYKKYQDKVDSLRYQIESLLLKYINPLCEYQDWMKRTSNRAHIDKFEIYNSRIECQCSIYVGCNETDTFEMNVPINFLYMNEEEQNNEIKLLLEDRKQKQLTEQRKHLEYEAKLAQQKLNDLNKRLGK